MDDKYDYSDVLDSYESEKNLKCDMELIEYVNASFAQLQLDKKTSVTKDAKRTLSDFITQQLEKKPIHRVSDLIPELETTVFKPSQDFAVLINQMAEKQLLAQKEFRKMEDNVLIQELEPMLFPFCSQKNVDETESQQSLQMEIDRFYTEKSKLPPFPVDPPTTREEVARNERLASLGIFDVQPIAKIHPKTNHIPLSSFSTPNHIKPDKRKHVEEITGPVLISTSSKMQTVPISEILKDLKAAGRLLDEQDKKKGFFFRKP